MPIFSCSQLGTPSTNMPVNCPNWSSCTSPCSTNWVGEMRETVRDSYSNNCSVYNLNSWLMDALTLDVILLLMYRD